MWINIQLQRGTGLGSFWPGPDYRPEKVNPIRPDLPDQPDWPDCLPDF